MLDRRSMATYPTVELLEGRDLPAVASVIQNGGVLTIMADHAATQVVVQPVGDLIQVKDLVTGHHWLHAAVQEIVFVGGAGHDRFIQGVPELSSKVWGNGGNDFLQGSSGADYIWGGPGDDILLGFGGDDRLYGEAGRDTLMGMNDNDLLFGGDGHDQLNGGAGTDKLWGGAGNDVLITLDNSTTDYAHGEAGQDTLWLDGNPSTRDSTSGQRSPDRLQWVTAFANGADRTLDGDDFADPEFKPGAVYKRFTGPLFGPRGPQATDPRQGDVGDCWLMAALGAIALDRPNTLYQNVVDFGDGTYGVRLGTSFFRVDGDLPVATPQSEVPACAGLGAGNSLWVAIIEKAYAHYRTAHATTNSYAALEAGWAVEVYRAFGAITLSNVAVKSYPSVTALGHAMYQAWSSYGALTIGFLGIPENTPLVNGHMYQVMSFVRNPSGRIVAVNLRNPWGVDGTSEDSNSSDGWIRVSLELIYSCDGRLNWARL